jgi:hypothetical protein
MNLRKNIDGRVGKYLAARGGEVFAEGRDEK